jgi:hypothetical protein
LRKAGRVSSSETFWLIKAKERESGNRLIYNSISTGKCINESFVEFGAMIGLFNLIFRARQSHFGTSQE